MQIANTKEKKFYWQANQRNLDRCFINDWNIER